MVELIAIDPGNNTGVAIFTHGELYWCGTDLPERESLAGVSVIECPRIYPRTRVNPNDIVDLAVKVGNWQRRLSFYGPVELVYPRTWKGSVPKAIHNKRVVAELTRGEQKVLAACGAACYKRHNVIDAIGLGLWWLKKEGLRV